MTKNMDLDDFGTNAVSSEVRFYRLYIKNHLQNIFLLFNSRVLFVWFKYMSPISSTLWTISFDLMNFGLQTE